MSNVQCPAYNHNNNNAACPMLNNDCECFHPFSFILFSFSCRCHALRNYGTSTIHKYQIRTTQCTHRSLNIPSFKSKHVNTTSDDSMRMQCTHFVFRFILFCWFKCKRGTNPGAWQALACNFSNFCIHFNCVIILIFEVDRLRRCVVTENTNNWYFHFLLRATRSAIKQINWITLFSDLRSNHQIFEQNESRRTEWKKKKSNYNIHELH